MNIKPCPFCLSEDDMPDDWSVDDLCDEHREQLEICNDFAGMFVGHEPDLKQEHREEVIRETQAEMGAGDD